ncbi:regulator of RNase E activity RraA [Aquabacter spiritensis]|uniref:Putative 4-hydroxy-4-methyl-2-oxoglutarate aldolase n=2 Tax=Aquabacter spiritensis TaxID=933073 RepID=A0A4R3LY36_9HYPH|nr:regulator of RNase E activity RraA [Aquabacter spiritensis]
MQPAHKVQTEPGGVSNAVLTALREIPTSHLSDNLQRLSGLCGLTRMHRARKMVGTAVTVRTRPGDNLFVYKALTLMPPGSVLVVDGGANATNALVGELMMLYARQHGCEGFVLDAAIRDRAIFYDEDFPCYARAVTHRGPFKNGPGEIDVPVTVGGQVVMPGDLVVGDEDGVVSFPVAAAESLIAAARRTAETERSIRAEIATGRREQAWLAKVLEPHGL